MSRGLEGFGNLNRTFRCLVLGSALGGSVVSAVESVPPPRLHLKASVNTAGPYGESWYLALAPDGAISLQVFYTSGPSGSLLAKFSLAARGGSAPRRGREIFVRSRRRDRRIPGVFRGFGNAEVAEKIRSRRGMTFATGC